MSVPTRRQGVSDVGWPIMVAGTILSALWAILISSHNMDEDELNDREVDVD